MEYNFWDDRTWYDHPCPWTGSNCYNVDEDGYSKCSDCEIEKEAIEYIDRRNNNET